MKLHYAAMIILGVLASTATAADRLQYQWIDQNGKMVTKDYPPANLQMRQVSRSGDLITLEIIGKNRLEDNVRLPPSDSFYMTPPSADSAPKSNIAVLCRGMMPLATAAYKAKQQGVSMGTAQRVATADVPSPEAATIMRDIVKAVYQTVKDESQIETIIYPACMIVYGRK